MPYLLSTGLQIVLNNKQSYKTVDTEVLGKNIRRPPLLRAKPTTHFSS